MSEGGDVILVVVALAAFAAAIAFLVWVSFRQRRALDAWLDAKLARERWIADPAETVVSPERSRWLRVLATTGFGSLSGTGAAGLDRVVVNPGRGVVEAAFVLARTGAARGWRLPPRRRWPRHAVGLGVVARLPRELPAPVVLLPQPATAPPLLKWVAGLDIPSVDVDDERVDESWTAVSDEPDAAAAMLAAEPALRGALVAIAERVLGHDWREPRLPLGASIRIGRTPRVTRLVIELAGDRAYLASGPKAIGQDPFPALQEAATLLADSLRGESGDFVVHDAP